MYKAEREGKEMEGKKNRNSLIDITRLFCAILVVAIHTRPFDSLKSAALIDAIGKINSIAVPMFLLIAGAFFWEKAEHNGVAYAKRYLRRIMTIYVFWSALYAVYTYCVYYDFSTLGAFIKLLVCQLLYYGTYFHLWYCVCVIYCALLSILFLHYLKMGFIRKYIFPFFFALYILMFFVIGQQLPMEAKRMLYNMPFFFLGTRAFQMDTKHHTVIILVISFVSLILEWSFVHIGFYPFSLFVFLPYLFRYMSMHEKTGIRLNRFGRYAQITSSIMYTSHFFIILFLERIIRFRRGDLIFLITVATELAFGWLVSRCKWNGLRYII